MSRVLVKPLSRIILFIVACGLMPLAHAATSANPRETIVKATLAEDDDVKRELIATLAGNGDEAIPTLLTAWRSDQLFLYAPNETTKIPVHLTGPKGENDAQDAIRIDTGKP